MSTNAKYMITGATGQLGRGIVDHLLTLVPASEIAVLVRDPAKSADLAALGVEIRRGDYSDVEALKKAFVNIEKLMLVSTTAFADALTQHRNVVDAAKAAGVKHVHYTAIQRPEGSEFILDQVTEWDRVTEAALAASGMAFTVFRNTMYFDALPFMMGKKVMTDGIRAPGGNGVAALAARHELAEASAIVLSQSGHEGRTYTLGSGDAVSIAEIAGILSKASGRTIPYTNLTLTEFVAERAGQGLPEFVVVFLAEWFRAIGAGEFAEITGDLERIIGRKPLNAVEFIPGLFGLATPEQAALRPTG
jgi:NAD(P)H dehydrogenase (quinone)